MTITVVTDPRSELVQLAADDIDHIVCDICWLPGMPMLCGERDYGGRECPPYCSEHPECSMCAEELESHWCEGFDD